jgi:hypothetical protein
VKLLKKHLQLIVVSLLFIIVFFLTSFPREEPDMYLHLAMGRLISEKGIINHDVYSHFGAQTQEEWTRIRESREYLHPEWLFQIVFYQFVHQFGFESYRVFVAIFAVIQVGVLYLFLRRIIGSRFFVSTILCLAYAIYSNTFFVARPQIISTTLLLLTLYILIDYVRNDRKRLIFLLPLSYIWVNLHPTVILGIFFAFAYSIVCLINGLTQADTHYWYQKFKVLFFFSLGMIICSTLPPQGYNSYHDLITTFQHTDMTRKLISEWGSIESKLHVFITYSVFAIGSFIVCIFILAIKKSFYKTVWLYPILLLIFAGTTSLRSLSYGFLSATILYAWALNHLPLKKLFKYQILLIITLLLTAFSYEEYTSNKLLTNQGSIFPKKAAFYLSKEYLNGNMYNQFGYGGYLEYLLYPKYKVFMDGRIDMYFCCEFKDLYNTLSTTHHYEQLFDQYHISYVILSTNDPDGYGMSNLLRKDSQFGLVFEADGSEIWIKNDGKNQIYFDQSKRSLDFNSHNKVASLFASPIQGIRFIYPSDLVVNILGPKLLSISEKASPDKVNLYIYNIKLSEFKDESSLPYSLPGTVTQRIIIPKQGFDASIALLSDGHQEHQVFILKGTKRVFAIYPPKDSSLDPQAILDIVMSINEYEP